MRNLKKVLSLVLCVAMMLSVMVVGAGAAFSDQSKIKNTEAVDACTALNIIGGYPDGSFKPEGNITRAEVTKMICVALNGGKNPAVSTNTTPTFSDVRNNANAAWAEGYIESCAAQGIVSGVGGGKFAPAGNVTGTQLAKMLLVALGYKADIEGFTGSAWATNVNIRATQKGLYKDLEKMDTNAAITRDNAAQMVWNALQAKEVKYEYTLVSENGTLTSKTTLVDKDLTLLKDKYDSDITKGVVTSIGHNSKGYLVTIDTLAKDSKNEEITVNPVNLSKVEKDPTDLVGKAVKALYKATDDVYGIYVDDENTATVVNTTLGDIDLSKDEYKLDGVTYKVKTGNFNKVQIDNFGDVEAVGALGAQLGKDASTKAAKLDDVVAATGTYAVSDASKVVLIDNDGDEKIDIAVVTPVQFGEITYLNAKNITVKGVLTNAKLEDCDIYKDAAKDDQVAVIAAAYSADENNVIVKLDTVSGKVDAVKTENRNTTEARINGTWYDVAVFDSKDKVNKDDKGDFFVYNGYIVAVDTTGGSISDTAYIISSSTAMDANGDYQAKVMMNGETKVVPMKKDTDLVQPGAADVYCTYEVDDGTYEFTAIQDKNKVLKDEYTAAAVKSYEDGRLYAAEGGKKATSNTEYLIDDNAVIFVKYNKDKHVILSGKDVAAWGDKVKNFNTSTASGSSASLVLYETGDKMMKVKGAFIDLAGDKMPASTASYGVIVSDIVSATDNKNEFTLWNGTDTIEVTTSDSGFAKWQVVEYVKNSDDTYDIDAVNTGVKIDSKDVLAGVVDGFGQFSIMDHTSNVVQLANYKLKATNYNITKDTQIIYVDTSASDTDGICVKGGSISDAGYAGKNTAGKDTYYRNATFVIDDGSDLDLLVVITNTKDASSGVIAEK